MGIVYHGSKYTWSIGICDTYPELKERMDVVYNSYKEGVKTLGTTEVEADKTNTGIRM